MLITVNVQSILMTISIENHAYVASVEPEPDTTGPENPERDDQESPEPSWLIDIIIHFLIYYMSFSFNLEVQKASENERMNKWI